MHRLPVVVLVVVACGGSSGSGHLPDASPLADGPITGGQPVTLTVTDGGAPKAGVHVYFLNADSSPVATVDTGADGVASAVMAAGGSVTALDPSQPERPDHVLFTYLGVKPGDHLSLANSGGASDSFTLSAPAVTGATNYDVFTTCGTDAIARDPAGGPTASGMVNLF